MNKDNFDELFTLDPVIKQVADAYGFEVWHCMKGNASFVKIEARDSHCEFFWDSSLDDTEGFFLKLKQYFMDVGAEVANAF
mgnify:CR=1 FL=1